MTVKEQQLAQDAFMIIRELAALCATPGIEVDTQKQANEGIKKILSGPIASSITKLSAEASGLVI